MNRIRNLRSGIAAFALVAAAASTPAFAQTEIVARPNPEADALQTQIRVLAENPRDVEALLAAGQLSTRMGDLAGALAFFQRAEAVEPGNARILSGRAAALVRLERPGEALRLFQQAESRGIKPAEYAADRGYAYDLLGQPELAQADYKLALAQRRDDETVRRYALSLGITGDLTEATTQIDTLLRGGDRASWRARAFILAMNGDVTGAEKIAARMMPGNMGESLTPFFRRIGALSPADRAFAVHFGELSPTQARLADARLAPTLPRYVGKAPVQMAQATPPTAPVVASKTTARDRRARRVETPKASPPVKPTPTPTPPPVAMARAEPVVQPAPERPVQLARADSAAPTAPVTRADTLAPRVALPPAPTPRVATQAAAPARRVGAEDSALASIIANLSIPEEELAAVNRVPAPVPVPAAAPVREAPEAAAEPMKPAPKPIAKAKPEPSKPESKPEPKAAPAKAEAKAKKPEPKKPDPARGEPKRVWVQVAGGANEGDLPRAWRGAVAKAPALKGKTGWWTPLRATNRVLTGPFKTASEAQAFVNTLGKSGLSGFVFTSDAGQKVTKLSQ